MHSEKCLNLFKLKILVSDSYNTHPVFTWCQIDTKICSITQRYTAVEPFCVEFIFPALAQIVSAYSSFLPQSKNTCVQLIGDSGCRCECEQCV